MGFVIEVVKGVGFRVFEDPVRLLFLFMWSFVLG